MTDNIKAKGDELVGKFIVYAHSEWHEVGGYDREMLYLNATRCAIIAVEEIIANDPMNPNDGGYYETMIDRRNDVVEYWKGVINYLKSKL